MDAIDAARALSREMPRGAFSGRAALLTLAKGGSDRLFYRISEGDRTAVLLADRGPELTTYIRIARFLRRCGIAVPEIYGADEEQGFVLMEDLGTLHLETALAGSSPEEELSHYRSCIDILVRFQTGVTTKMLEEDLLAGKRFDRETLLGETEYFEREFIGRFCPVTIEEAWTEERIRLADFLARQPAVFMHRDFQSRNILIKEGRLRVIDFQSAHRGPGLYDAASLLKDPYHPLPARMREILLAELYDRLAEGGAVMPGGFDAYREAFVMAGIQRNLQALAAFARLGLSKGKREFLESIPPGLDLLEEGIEDSGRFPAMKRMVCRIREKMEKGNE